MGQADRAQFEVLYRGNIRPLLAYVLTSTNRDNAHDVVSSTFLVAWRRFDQVPVDALPWLMGVARRVLADQWRAESRREALGDRLAGDALAGGTSVNDVADAMVLRGSIREALMRMRPEDREVVTLAAWQGFTTEQLATALGCTKARSRQ
ncbi:MAG TPA: sigma factor [Acidimicrobiales bacterium]|nr:sigma factor [Acidimicrobiales bacterium]